MNCYLTIAFFLLESLILSISASPFVSTGFETTLTDRALDVAAGCTAISPPPTGSSCGVKGSLSSPVPANDIAYAGSLQACQALCSRHHDPRGKPIPVDPTSAGCISFGYTPLNSTCALYGTFIHKMGFEEDSKSTTTFYDERCYSCPAQCPQSYSKNLLDNSGFEVSSELIGPWNTGGKGGLVTPGYHSEHAFLCSHLQDCNIFQTVQACPGATYHLSMVYKINSTTQQTNTFSIVSGNMEFLDFVGNTNGSWQTLDAWFTTDSHRLNGIYIDFYPNSGKSDTDFYIDNVKLVHDLTDYKPIGPQKVKNGGFETGSLAPFKAHTFGRNSLTVVSSDSGGNYSLLFKGTVTDRDGTNSLKQILDLKPGSMYLLEYFGRKVKGQAEYPDVFIGDILYEAPYPTTAGSSFHFALPFVARSNKVLLELDFLYGPLLIDYISVKQF